MTQTNITLERRNQIKNIAARICELYNNPNLPLEIKSLTRSFSNIRLTSYSKYMKRVGVSYEYLISIAQDSYTDYYADQNMYYIYYNDIDRNIVNSNRYRWNIAHELGHVMLQHLSKNEKTRLIRPALPDDEYFNYEEEADYFAQLILVPHAALICFRIDNARDIRYLCKISDPASKRRYYEYVNWKRHLDAQDAYDRRIFNYYFPFAFKRKCKTCGAGLIQRYGRHCPICGSKNTLEWGDGDKMKYPLLETHDNGKLKECPHCANEETDIEGDFCQICGKSLVNRCATWECGNTNILPSNARHCPMCGGNSVFFNADFLKEWDYKEKSPNEFWSIPDGIDPDTLPFN